MSMMRLQVASRDLLVREAFVKPRFGVFGADLGIGSVIMAAITASTTVTMTVKETWDAGCLMTCDPVIVWPSDTRDLAGRLSKLQDHCWAFTSDYEPGAWRRAHEILDTEPHYAAPGEVSVAAPLREDVEPAEPEQVVAEAEPEQVVAEAELASLDPYNMFDIIMDDFIGIEVPGEEECMLPNGWEYLEKFLKDGAPEPPDAKRQKCFNP
jgi:hypothetical protein